MCNQPRRPCGGSGGWRVNHGWACPGTLSDHRWSQNYIPREENSSRAKHIAANSCPLFHVSYIMDRQLLANILRLALLFTSLRCASPAPNNRPIVGVLSMPTASVHNANLTGYGTSFIAASYIKWVESAGAHARTRYLTRRPMRMGSNNSVDVYVRDAMSVPVVIRCLSHM